MINGIFLLLGSNIGDRKWYLERARELLTARNILLLDASSIYLTPPWGKTDQPYFLNQVLKIETPLPPDMLMAACLETESELGRVRKEHYGERTIDIDLLYYNDLVIDSGFLTVPHPRLHLRRFALAPLAEIAPHFIHPVIRLNQTELLEACPDSLPVRKLQ